MFHCFSKALQHAKNYVNNLSQKLGETKRKCMNLQPVVTEYANMLTADICHNMSPSEKGAGLYKLTNHFFSSTFL